MTTLADDPLAFNVKREAMRLVVLLSVVCPLALSGRGFAQIEDRVWFECDHNDEGSFFEFTLDPLDGEEKGTIRKLTLRARSISQGAADVDLLTTDQEDLFWWAMWLTEFRASLRAEI